MACLNKFHNDLHLGHLDFEPTTLIVGTFDPEWPEGSAGEWFYGRAANNYFWHVLPRLYGEASLINATSDEWKQFCHDKKIAITDLISAIEDADPADPEHNKILASLSDKAIVFNFDDFVYVNIVQILKSRPSIKNVYLTRGITEAFWKHLWNPVTQYCNLNGLHERILLNPSDSALYQHEAYNTEYPDDAIPLLEDYLLMRWKQEWHF